MSIWHFLQHIALDVTLDVALLLVDVEPIFLKVPSLNVDASAFLVVAFYPLPHSCTICQICGCFNHSVADCYHRMDSSYQGATHLPLHHLMHFSLLQLQTLTPSPQAPPGMLIPVPLTTSQPTSPIFHFLIPTQVLTRCPWVMVKLFPSSTLVMVTYQLTPPHFVFIRFCMFPLSRLTFSLYTNLLMTTTVYIQC